MTSSIKPTILIIFGVTGDLSRRKLLPAIEMIAASTIAPESLRIVGVTRQQHTSEDVLGKVSGEVDYVRKHLEVYSMSLTKLDEYVELRKHLDEIEREMGEPAQRLIYLSVPPQISRPIVELLGESGIADIPDTKLLLEKPFGVDLASAKELVAQAKKYFREDQLYRIDHYLAKEMTQNLVVFRQQNSLFKHTWNNQFIDSIEIVASETIGIEGRAEFYEQTGALRDLVQSHLLQLAALTLADLPKALEDGDWKCVPSARLRALQDIITPSDIPSQARRGQYASYRDEVKNPDTTVETFVALTLFSKDPRWEGVPIRLITGKALNKKTTEIRITYKRDNAREANRLILHIQPNEGVEIDLWAKRPGYDREQDKLSLNFAYSNHFTDLPEAYERVFVDAMRSDHSLFTGSDEVLETWRILDPIQKAWEMDAEDLVTYESGAAPDNSELTSRPFASSSRQ